MDDFWEFLGFLVILVMAIVVIFMVLVACIVPFEYYSACRSADVYNKLNNTSFTCSDFLWAGDQINFSTHTIKMK